MRSLLLALVIVLTFPQMSLSQQPPADAWRFDINEDGQIGAVDLLYFLSLWGQSGIATPTPFVCPSSTPTITQATPTFTVTPTMTETLTNTETLTETPTPSETAIPTVSPTEEPTLTSTEVFSDTPTETATPSETTSPTLSPTEELTFTPSVTPTEVLQDTFTETPTTTESETGTATESPTETDTATVTMTESPTESGTMTVTATETQTSADTPVPTETATEAPTLAPTFEVITIPLPNLPAGAHPLRLVRIPAGSFLMGNTGGRDSSYTWELPRHEVTFETDFYLGETEVTQAQWQAVMGSNPASFRSNINNPVEGVNWNDCQAFLAAINVLPGISGLRLPAEAEWECGARGPEWNPNRYEVFSFGDDLAVTNLNTCDLSALFDQYMWYCGNSQTMTHPVASKLPNLYGLYDMHGNVWEWCQDRWHDNYNDAPTDGSVWETGDSTSKVYRGGSWQNFAKSSRTSYRTKSIPGHGYSYLGLRLAKSL